MNSDLSANHESKHSLKVLALAALGVVFGDIGTSPIYALRECFHGEYSVAVSSVNIYGVLSLMFWSLIIIVSLKYLTFIMRADNRGEGGIIAMTALIHSKIMQHKKHHLILIAFGIFAACLLYGDGMITPAISVLSAVEGLEIITPAFQPIVIPATLLILAMIFFLQRRGTAKIGMMFGPIVLVWFLVLAILGTRQIIGHPEIFKALLPWYGINFLFSSGLHGFTVLGAVFLVVTGTEVLYADMGHFGRKPIRLVWTFLVLPSLVLNYFGQGAYLLANPGASHHPFYNIVPSWGLIPMVVLSTCATIIASQAVITGVFSLTRQAIQLGYLPRMKIVHTSTKHLGQIYVPQINWMLMIATLGLVVWFQSPSKLAAAYGVAVTSTMLIASVLFYFIAREQWKWNRLFAGLPVLLFLIVDICFFSANIVKIFHGAWFPLAIGAALFIVMTTWRRGRRLLYEQLRSASVSLGEFIGGLSADEKPIRIKRKALFMTGQPDSLPTALAQNLKHNMTVHSDVGILHFSSVDIPRVPNNEKVKIEKLGSGFYRINVRMGFMEEPDIPNALSLAKGQGVDFPLEETSFFLGREKLIAGQGKIMRPWRSCLFAFLSRNAYDASFFYDIPEEQVMEVGIQLKL